jgi:hypothetical protein
VLLQHDMELSNDHLQQSLVKIRTPSFSPDFARPPSGSLAVQYPILEWQIDRVDRQAGMPLCSSEKARYAGGGDLVGVGAATGDGPRKT